MNGCATVESIKERINLRVNELYNEGWNDDLCSYVCCVCDEFILRQEDVQVVSIKKMKSAKALLSWRTYRKEEDSIKGIEDGYRFMQHVPNEMDQSWLEGMALSPRGSLKKLYERQPPGFVTCRECKHCIENNKMPLYAIVNNNFVGCPPDELLELNQVELSFLTPMKSYGYFFTYEGGHMKQMKGSLTFMRVEERSITKAVTTLECMGLTKHVVVLTNGPMTKAQQQKVKESTTCRTEKMISAVKWLCAHHKSWKEVDVEKIIHQIGRTQPIRVEKSTTCDSGNATVEDEVVFTCYYPDGATNNQTGGFHSPEDFKTFVEQTKQQNFDVELKAHIEREFVKCSDGDHLISACLLQFPYGLGSMDESRMQPNGKMSSKTDLSQFLDHLSRKSDPLFQTSLLQLILYSMKNKARLLRSSGLQLKHKIDAQALAEGFDATDFSKACKGRREGKRKGGKISNTLLDAVDATARDLPHSDKAAKLARSSMESMFHHLGMGSVFLTVTFDDENSLLLQVMTGVRLDKEENIDDLSDEELSKRAEKRRMIRFDFPGAAALNFEILLNILLEEVICWDINSNEAINGKSGLFGQVKGLAFAVEEQGRKTLHVHFILWIEGYDKLQEWLFFGDHFTRPEATGIASKYFDHLATTSLFTASRNTELRQAFDHDNCSVTKISERELPNVASDAELRILRHKMGYEYLEGCFASCPHCDKQWTYEELVNALLSKGYDIKDKVTPSQGSSSKRTKKEICKERLYAKIVQFQHPNATNESEPTVCINAAYQSHVSCHHKNCFRCSKEKGKKKRKHVCGKNCECRYRLPDKRRKVSRLHVQKDDSPWFMWNGQEKKQPIVQFLPKRGTYDLFQNVSCAAISESKFTCNSNVTVITDGPIGMYCCKYINKPNEKDDTAEYSQVEATMKKMEQEGPKHESEKAEALRILCRAAFAHNRSNIVSASMASFLTRHNSRFYFSHKFVFCPLKDVIRLHNEQDVTGVLKVSPTGKSFFENQALHYLCRPIQLENFSLKAFTENYEVGFVTKKSLSAANPMLPFLCSTDFFTHPSAGTKGRGRSKTESCSQGVKAREDDTYAKVPQWAFPDTQQFRDNILTCADDKINRAMELYAQMVLTLLLPHRHFGELQCPDNPIHPYTHKLRKCYEEDSQLKASGLEPTVFTDSNLTFLQNIQNAAYNSVRYKGTYDELAETTVPFDYSDPDGVAADDSEDDDNEAQDGYEEFVESLARQYSRPVHDDDPSLLLSSALKNFSFESIRENGDERCGFAMDIDLPEVESTADPLIEVITQQEFNERNKNKRKQKANDFERKKYSVKELTKVLLKKTTKCHRNVWEGKSINVGEATGSVKSLREWSKAGFGTDKKQQRAFEAIAAAFILTFHDESNEDVVRDGTETQFENRCYRHNRKCLLKLKSRSQDPQLIALLHGPGGSGKSTVINMVTSYAKSFCESIGHEFTSRTIVLTALSGVAATLLHGETTHMALGMNKKKIPASQKAEFNDTRLIIVDEISFASVETIQRIQECLQLLTHKSFRKYGGVNIVFAGDYCQLDPVRCKEKVWERKDVQEFHQSINCFIELSGKHRFADDPEWGELLLRFRNGEPTEDDIDLINEECHVDFKNPPPGIQVATYFNKNRDAINSAIFEDWCDKNNPGPGKVLNTACVVLMDSLEMSKSNGCYQDITSNQVKSFFYQNCGENDCKMSDSNRGRVDPVLKIYPGCPMMLTQNNDVPNGQANGSRVRVKRIRLKPDEQPGTMKLDCGTTIRALFASQVEAIVVEHENESILPHEFEATMSNWTFTTKLEVGPTEMKVRMKGSQFPLISNSCTTGHKLQGCTLDQILVNDWMYKQNWAYVVLSRVRTMNGLYIRQNLDPNVNRYRKNKKIEEMLKNFRDTVNIPSFSDRDYELMIQEEEAYATQSEPADS